MKVVSPIVGLVLAVLSPAAAAEWQIAQWDQTVYYRLTFNAAEATQAALRLTAINEYEVFLNGDSVGSDGDWTTVEELAVELQGGANHLAVRVENWGQGNGSGLIVEVVADEQVWLSNYQRSARGLALERRSPARHRLADGRCERDSGVDNGAARLAGAARAFRLGRRPRGGSNCWLSGRR